MTSNKKEVGEGKIREAIKNFVIKHKGQPGWYHNGSYGVCAPTAEVSINKPQNGYIGVSYSCGSRYWDFTFSVSEITN